VPIADQTAQQNQVFTYTFVVNTFADVDVGDSLSYSSTLSDGSVLPAWLTFDPLSRTFSGTPTSADVGNVLVRVMATDLTGASVVDDFNLTVANSINHAPVLSSALLDQGVKAGTPWSYNTGGSFQDQDIVLGDALNYVATFNGGALPAWLSINSNTGQLSGTPALIDLGLFTIRVTANDVAGLSVFDEFTLTIASFDPGHLLMGSSGNDVFAGTSGVDTVSYNDAISAVTVSLAKTAQQNTGGAGLDTLTNIDNLIGSAFADKLTGNSGNNVLDGGLGADNLSGGRGNDTYIVDNIADVVTENSNAGIDQVFSFVSYKLRANVEQLTLIGTGNLNGTGNNLANLITGNDSANIINDGGIGGLDTLVGGAGNDTYIVNNSGDIITELVGGGTDLISSAVSFSLSSVANVENLTLTGTAIINGSGNNDNNIITGNSAVNKLSGNDGNDTLYGFDGRDVINGGNGNDLIVGGAGNDLIVGGAGNDLIVGGAGNDTLTGGIGADTFWFDSAANRMTNKDTITDFVSGTDMLQFSKAVLNALGTTPGQFAVDDQRFWSNATGVAHDATDRLIYNNTTGVLSYDSDGNGAAAAVQLEVLGATTHPALVATDIWVV
jgi:Ca2+-binding RTX toxin-like protein